MEIIKRKDYVLVVTEDGKKYLLQVKERLFHTHKDYFDLKELIGKRYGEKILGKKGHFFYILKPTIFDFLIKIERKTQIIYPKEIGYILLKLDIREGKKVLECGTGSGALTCALAYMVGKEGKVFSYEKEEKFLKLAQKNLKKLNLLDRVELKHKKVTDEFDEKKVDAVFLDVKEPWELIKPAWKSLKGGCPLGILVPTTNQVCFCLKELKEQNFANIEVLEIFLRNYKINPERLRPEDEMIAHTGFLIFAQKLLNDKENFQQN